MASSTSANAIVILLNCCSGDNPCKSSISNPSFAKASVCVASPLSRSRMLLCIRLTPFSNPSNVVPLNSAACFNSDKASVENPVRNAIFCIWSPASAVFLAIPTSAVVAPNMGAVSLVDKLFPTLDIFSPAVLSVSPASCIRFANSSDTDMELLSCDSKYFN